MKTIKIINKYKLEITAIVIFLIGGSLCMLGLVQKIPLVLGVVGVIILTVGMLYFFIRFLTEKSYKDYYMESYNIEHSTIEEEIKKSMVYHRYQEAVLNRYESLCRDLGINDEQRDYLLLLLMEEKNKVDKELQENGGGYI